MATKKATPAAKAAPAKKPCAKKACCAKTVKDVKPAAIKEMKASQVHQILGKYILCDGYDMVVDTEKSHGSYMYDAKHNKEYLDFFSFFASMPIGFNHPNGKRGLFAHVAFADGHVEKLAIPAGPGDGKWTVAIGRSELEDLTEWLCKGEDVFFDGAKYEKRDD